MSKITIDNIIDVLLICLVIVLPISIALTNFIWLPVLLLTIIKFCKYPNTSIFKQKVNLPIYFFVVVSVISILFAIDFRESILELRKIGQILLIFIFWYNIKNTEQARKLIKILFVSTVVCALFGLLQYMIGINAELYGDVWVYKDVPGFFTKLPENILKFLALNDGRIQGPQSFYLTFAEILIMVFFLNLPLTFFNIREKGFSKNITLKSIIPYLLIVICILFTYARGVWLSLIITLGFLFLVNKKIRISILKLVLITALLISIIAVFNLQRRSFIDRFKSISFTQNIDRISMWRSGLKIIKDYPFLGIGPRCVPLIYPKYVMPTAARQQEGHLHSNFVQIAVDRGIIGLIAFCWMFLSFFFYFLKVYAKSDNGFAKYAGLSGVVVILSFSISGLTEYSFGDAEVAILLWSILGLLFASISKSKEIGIKRTIK